MSSGPKESRALLEDALEIKRLEEGSPLDAVREHAKRFYKSDLDAQDLIACLESFLSEMKKDAFAFVIPPIVCDPLAWAVLKPYFRDYWEVKAASDRAGVVLQLREHSSDAKKNAQLDALNKYLTEYGFLRTRRCIATPATCFRQDLLRAELLSKILPDQDTGGVDSVVAEIKVGDSFAESGVKTSDLTLDAFDLFHQMIMQSSNQELRKLGQHVLAPKATGAHNRTIRLKYDPSVEGEKNPINGTQLLKNLSLAVHLASLKRAK